MCFLVYTVSYVGKYSYSTNIQNVIFELQVSKQEAGYVTSAYFFCYGAGQFINGILCEKCNSKWMIAVSLWISAILTGAFFFIRNILLMTVLWGMNGLVLSTLWCHCIKLIATIQEEKYVAKSVTVMSLTVPVGTLLIYAVSTLFTYLQAWKIIYLFASGLLFAVGMAFLLSVGNVQANRAVGGKALNVGENGKATQNRGLFAAFGWVVVPLFVFSVCVGFLRDGAITWMPVLLVETFSVPDFFSIFLTLGMPLMGAFTAFLATLLIKLTKNVFSSFLVAGCFASVGGIALVFIFHKWVAITVLLFMALAMAGYMSSNTSTSLLPLLYKEQIKSGQSAGLINGFIYVGSALASVFLGGLVDNFGWNAFMICIFACALLMAFSALIGACATRRKASE